MNILNELVLSFSSQINCVVMHICMKIISQMSHTREISDIFKETFTNPT